MSQRSLDLVIKKLEKESKGSISIMIEMLNQSIENGWTGVFPIHNGKFQSDKKAKNIGNFAQREYEDDYLKSFYEKVGEEIE